MATLFLTFYGPRRKRICNYTPQERVEEANKIDQQRIYYIESKKNKATTESIADVTKLIYISAFSILT